MRLEEQRAAYLRSQNKHPQCLEKEAQEGLFKTNRKIKEEELTDKVDTIERELCGKKYGTAWKVINKITYLNED